MTLTALGLAFLAHALLTEKTSASCIGLEPPRAGRPSVRSEGEIADYQLSQRQRCSFHCQLDVDILATGRVRDMPSKHERVAALDSRPENLDTRDWMADGPVGIKCLLRARRDQSASQTDGHVGRVCHDVTFTPPATARLDLAQPVPTPAMCASRPPTPAIVAATAP